MTPARAISQPTTYIQGMKSMEPTLTRRCCQCRRIFFNGSWVPVSADLMNLIEEGDVTDGLCSKSCGKAMMAGEPRGELAS